MTTEQKEEPIEATYTELVDRVLMSQPESLRRSVEEKMREQHPDPDAFASMLEFRHAAEAEAASLAAKVEAG